MGRLIDADKLIEEMRKWYFDSEKQKSAKKDCSPMDLFTNLAITTVHAQPTAYDPDKVVEQLEEEKELSYADFDEYVNGVCPYLDAEYDDLFHRGLERAIEIVKGGGVD